MSYAGMYDSTPVPEPRKKPKIKVLLFCGEEALADSWWSSDPIYGGWNHHSFAYCFKHKKTESVKNPVWPPDYKY